MNAFACRHRFYWFFGNRKIKLFNDLEDNLTASMGNKTFTVLQVHVICHTYGNRVIGKGLILFRKIQFRSFPVMFAAAADRNPTQESSCYLSLDTKPSPTDWQCCQISPSVPAET